MRRALPCLRFAAADLELQGVIVLFGPYSENFVIEDADVDGFPYTRRFVKSPWDRDPALA